MPFVNAIWRQINKDKVSTKRAMKVSCECGAKVTYGNLAKHRRTYKHTDFAETVK